MNITQVKLKLKEMLEIISSIEKVETELKHILGPINQFGAAAQEKVLVKAKPRDRIVRQCAYAGLNRLPDMVKKVWYYSKENTVPFSSQEIAMLVGIDPKKVSYMWNIIRREITYSRVIIRAADSNGKRKYKIQEKAANKIKAYIENL
jgi:hypothetical protein